MLSKIWHDTDAIVYTLLSISVANIHQTLSLFGLGLSITYTIIKIKQDFFNNKK
jgi:hypothetical protein